MNYISSSQYARVLTDQNPFQVADYLLARLELYVRSARPVNNKPDDENFKPNVTWGPWIQ